MSRAAAGVAALAGALVLAACGGGDEDHPTPTEPPAELLEQAAANPASSGEAAIDIDMDLEGDTILAGAAGFEATGPFDLGDGTGLPAFELDGEGAAAGFGIDADLISTGDDAFVIFFGENYRVGPERFAEAEAALAEASGGAGGIGLDVAGWFRDPSYAGSEEVGGTRHREDRGGPRRAGRRRGPERARPRRRRARVPERAGRGRRLRPGRGLGRVRGRRRSGAFRCSSRSPSRRTSSR